MRGLFEMLGFAAHCFARLHDKCLRSYQLSRIRRGKNCVLRGAGQFEGNIALGDGVVIGKGACFLSSQARIVIGSKVLLGPNVTIVTGDHQISRVGEYIADVLEKTEACDADVVIEDDVWIGAGTVILKGVTVGRGSVIGAGSVVTASTKPYSVSAGNPCRMIRMRFSEEEIAEHEQKLYGTEGRR